MGKKPAIRLLSAATDNSAVLDRIFKHHAMDTSSRLGCGALPEWRAHATVLPLNATIMVNITTNDKASALVVGPFISLKSTHPHNAALREGAIAKLHRVVDQDINKRANGSVGQKHIALEQCSGSIGDASCTGKDVLQACISSD